MSPCASVIVHRSQFPDRVRRDLLDSLRSRRVQHKFHYDSYKQAAKWLRLHQAFSPSRTDPDCARIYDRGFAALAEGSTSGKVHLVGLGCGGGQKEVRLLELFRGVGREITYSPVDVSLPLVLAARQRALESMPDLGCMPMVCDLSSSDDPTGALLELGTSGSHRLFTFFGMIPNFEPGFILPRLAALVRAGDQLLFSANLAAGSDYAAGVERVLPLYDNPLTRDWLMTFLLDLGVETPDGEMRFGIQTDPANGLRRIAAHFHFMRDVRVQAGEDAVDFCSGETIQLFFSYRHTPEIVRALFGRENLQVKHEWITASGEEGVFLVNRATDTQ